MSNWLTTLGPFLTGGIKIGATLVPGGPAMVVGAPMAATLLKAIVAAEMHHFDKIAKFEGPVVDTRQQGVISSVMASMPLIEALALATGHPIPDAAAFEAALPEAINTTIAALNAQAKLLGALGVKV